MKRQLSPVFFLKYAWNTGRKNRFRKRLMTVVCAAAVAFAAVALGQFSDYLKKLDVFMRNISDRELVVFNDIYAGNPFDSMNPPVSPEKVEQMAGLPGVERVEPLLLFSSVASPYSRKLYASELAAAYDLEDSRVVCTNAAGLKTQRSFNIDSLYTSEGRYAVLSYPEEEKLERMAVYRDGSVEEGVYITENFMKLLGLAPEDLNGLSLAFDVWLDTAQRAENMLVTDYFEDGTTEESEVPASVPFSQKLTLTEQVKGVIPETYYDQASDACIYMSADRMEQILADCPKDEEAMAYITEYLKEINPDKVVEDFSERYPNAYYVVVESLEDVAPVKEAIEGFDPNFTILHEYQNVGDARQALSGSRNMMIYVTFAILTVVLLLMALIYVGLIDKRQFEFAVLRANGLTKREVRRVVCVEMALQCLKITVLGVGLAFIIYKVGLRWYAFQFDGMTVLWLFLISLGAVVLPTVLSLLFVNRFEPDQVMRN